MTPHHAQHRLSLYATAVAVATFGLLIAGGLVTSTDSGLAVPDWPLSYGTLFPPMVGGIRFEHSHRLLAGLVGILIVGLALWLQRAEPRRWVRRLGWIAVAMVGAQALLGGLTVLWLLPPQVSIAHACLGQSVFTIVVLLAWCLRPDWPQARPAAMAGSAMVRGFSLLIAAATGAQLVLGAVLRHTGLALPAHLSNGLLLLVAAGALTIGAARARATPLWPHLVRLDGLLVLQVIVGIQAAWYPTVIVRTAHVATGALLLAQAVVLAWATQRSLPTHPRQRWRDYLELTKPRLTALVLATTAAGFWLGMRRPAPGWACSLIGVLVGTACVAGGANALNQWAEHDADSRMRRTRSRPIPAGRLMPSAAWWFGVVVSLGGLMGLLLMSRIVCGLALLSWASYVLVYTPLKRITPLCTLVGAIPGALPPMIGWAAARGQLHPEAWVLFGIVFLWQLPHFLALAVLYRDDYMRAGFRMLPLVDPDSRSAAGQMVLYGLALLPVSLIPTSMGLAGGVYFAGAAVLSAGFVVLAARAAWLRSMQSAHQLFLASIVYLPALLGLLVCNKTPL